MLKGLVTELFSHQPTTTLYHYTSLDGLLGIVNDKQIWGTDYRYLNDAAEVEYFLDILDGEIEKRMAAEKKPLETVLPSDVSYTDKSGSLEQQQSESNYLSKIAAVMQKRLALENLGRWWRTLKSNDGSVLVASFIEDGDLLSQWRGYSEFGKGVSIGFDPHELAACAGASVQIGKCVYDPEMSSQIGAKIVNVLVEATAWRPAGDAEKVLQAAQVDLFKIAALIKHPKFKEEREWRLVQAVQAATSLGMQFRRGSMSLIPYVDMPLPVAGSALKIERVVVGPTAIPELSIASMKHYLLSKGIAAQVRQSEIPYRGK